MINSLQREREETLALFSSYENRPYFTLIAILMAIFTLLNTIFQNLLLLYSECLLTTHSMLLITVLNRFSVSCSTVGNWYLY